MGKTILPYTVTMNKLLIGLGAFIGSTIASYIPLLWGGSLLSVVSIFFSVIGGVAGTILGYRLGKYLGFG
jgi:hypothetical protein